MWVLQVFTLAEGIVLASGNVLLNWGRASAPPWEGAACPCNGNVPDANQIIKARNSRRAFAETFNREFRIADSLLLVRKLECLDVRDRFFGIFGLAAKAYKAGLPSTTA